jgi:CHAT domain-containing protein
VTVGYLTSTFELAEAEPSTKVATDSLRSLLIGAPEFGSGAGPIVLTDAGPCQMTPFEALPGAEREIADIESIMGSPTKLLGAKVTRARIEKALDDDPWLVHFATHAYFAGGAGCGASSSGKDELREAAIAPNPLLLSGIVLAGANQPARVGGSSQSGILTAYEVSGLDLRSAGLVVLSACDTGTGLQLRGQEVQGLRWGFRAAGAGALVTSLWKSNDDATRRLMRAFYQALASDDLTADVFRGAAALREAQLAQVKAERMIGMQRPATWANFIFSGVL